MILVEQTAIKTRSRGWNVSMALPKIEQAKQYRRILAGLGYESKPPEKTENGFVVKWRPKKGVGERGGFQRQNLDRR